MFLPQYHGPVRVQQLGYKRFEGFPVVKIHTVVFWVMTQHSLTDQEPED
jgi:hypothetical protein